MQQCKLSSAEMESFTDESIKACLLQVQKGDKMMAEKVKLLTAKHLKLWTCFRCEAVFHQEIPYQTKIRRTKLSKFRLGVENFVRRKILSV